MIMRGVGRVGTTVVGTINGRQGFRHDENEYQYRFMERRVNPTGKVPFFGRPPGHMDSGYACGRNFSKFF